MTPEQQALVADNDDVVQQTAYVIFKRFPPGAFWEREDIVQAGRVGLCEAAVRWRPGSAPFSAYARRRVHGAIIDMLRATMPMAGARRIWSRSQMFVLTERDQDDFYHPQPDYERSLTAKQIVRWMWQLPDRRQALMLAGWLRGEDQPALGQTMARTDTRSRKTGGVGPSRVSQLQRDGLARLRQLASR